MSNGIINNELFGLSTNLATPSSPGVVKNIPSSVQTTGAVPTVIYTITMVPNSTVCIAGTIIAKSIANDSSLSGGYRAGVRSDGSNILIPIGGIFPTILTSQRDNVLLNVTASITGSDFNILVTGLVGVTYDWFNFSTILSLTI